MATRKKKFGTGGDVEGGSTIEEGDTPVVSAESEPEAPSQTFKQAFASARKAGDKTFSWNGKSFTTDVAASGGPSRKPSTGGTQDIATGAGRKPTPPAAKYETPYDRLTRKTREAEAAPRVDRTIKNPNMLKEAASGAKLMGTQKYAKGGKIDGIAQRGKTRGRVC